MQTFPCTFQKLSQPVASILTALLLSNQSASMAKQQEVHVAEGTNPLMRGMLTYSVLYVRGQCRYSTCSAEGPCKPY